MTSSPSSRVLTEMFLGGAGSSNLLDSADNQVAPGSGLSTTSSNDRLSVSANSPASAGGFAAGRGGQGMGGQGGGIQTGFGGSQANNPTDPQPVAEPVVERATPELTARVTRDAETKKRISEFLGLNT